MRAFGDFWSAPTPERFRALMHPEAHLVQPLAPDAHWHRRRRGVVQPPPRPLLPDIRITVRSWGGTAEALFIEWTAHATFGGKAWVRWDAVDRFRLEGGLVRERVAHFDALPLVATILARPAGWLHALRTRLAAPRHA